MPLIDWIPLYNTGIIEIDIDNLQLVSIINTLHDSMTSKNNHEIVNKMITILVHNYQDHCTLTTQVLTEINYPFLSQQQESHHKYGRILATYLQRVNKKEKISPMELIGFLRNWFDKHIKIEDQQLKGFIKKNNSQIEQLIVSSDVKQLEWDKTLILDNEEMNKEHKHLVEIYNVLCRAIDAKKGKKTIIKIIHTYKQYAEQHFQDEEMLMQNYNYSALEEHIEIHKQLIQEMDKVLKTITEQDSFSNKNLLEYCKNWLVNHIINEDKKFVDQLSHKNELVT